MFSVDFSISVFSVVMSVVMSVLALRFKRHRQTFNCQIWAETKITKKEKTGRPLRLLCALLRPARNLTDHELHIAGTQINRLTDNNIFRDTG